MIRVVEAVQTCGACPSQWEGRTEDGRHVYARYRWGHLSVSIGADADSAVLGQQLFEMEHGDSYDGSMDEYTLADLTADVIEWPWSRDAR